MVKKRVELQQFTGEARSRYCGKPRIPHGEGSAGPSHVVALLRTGFREHGRWTNCEGHFLFLHNLRRRSSSG